MEFNFPARKNISILALGAESAGNFSVFKKNKIYASSDFGDLLEEKNWKIFKKEVLLYLKNHKIKPKIILTDLHPLFHTTHWGKELAKKYKALHVQVQHHIAHTFSAVGDKIVNTKSYKLPAKSYALACDGTGYGLDEKIWGGEVFRVESRKYKVESIGRIGHLENQTLIGGDAAIREPARMLIGIINKFLGKEEIYDFVKKYYSRNEFELIYSQLQQNFNCEGTSSAGRILDAVSLLLGFCENKRRYKHEPIDLLEKNSGKPYTDLNPKIIKDNIGKYVLNTTYLFKYLLKYPPKNKKHLAATAQLYLAQGLWEIIERNLKAKTYSLQPEIFFAGGIANNKIISSYLESKGAYTSKTIPRGDAGLSFGQIVYYLIKK